VASTATPSSSRTAAESVQLAPRLGVPQRPEHPRAGPGRPEPAGQARPVRKRQAGIKNAEAPAPESAGQAAVTNKPVGASAQQALPAHRNGREPARGDAAQDGRWNSAGLEAAGRIRTGWEIAAEGAGCGALYAALMGALWVAIGNRSSAGEGSQRLALCAGRAPGRTGWPWLSTCCSRLAGHRQANWSCRDRAVSVLGRSKAPQAILR